MTFAVAALLRDTAFCALPSSVLTPMLIEAVSGFAWTLPNPATWMVGTFGAEAD
jgi:hypothetical protein